MLKEKEIPQTKEKEGLINAEASIKFTEPQPILLILLAYFAVTAYLAMHAQRFISLLSVPVSIIGAFSVYWLLAFFKTKKMKDAYYLTWILLIIIIGIMVYTDYRQIQLEKPII